MKTIFVLLIAFLFLTNVQAQTVIPLYKTVPNAIAGPDEEVTELINNTKSISKVSTPTLTIFLPSKDKANGAAVIICPGGGYTRLVVDHEGTEVAKELNKAGIAAFVLKYRLPNDKIMTNKEIGPLQDAQQSIKLVRQHAKEWNVDPAKVGIMGFSAGGHLAASATTHFSSPVIENEGISVRPDFSILMYGVISFNDSTTHMGSRNSLIGRTPAKDKVSYYSNELQVTKQTPSVFLVHAQDDNLVPVANSIDFYKALVAKSVPSELIIYPKGGHGFGLVNATTRDRWLDNCLNWMRSNNWIK